MLWLDLEVGASQQLGACAREKSTQMRNIRIC
jgi:hypothetical protein